MIQCKMGKQHEQNASSHETINNDEHFCAAAKTRISHPQRIITTRMMECLSTRGSDMKKLLGETITHTINKVQYSLSRQMEKRKQALKQWSVISVGVVLSVCLGVEAAALVLRWRAFQKQGRVGPVQHNGFTAIPPCLWRTDRQFRCTDLSGRPRSCPRWSWPRRRRRASLGLGSWGAARSCAVPGNATRRWCPRRKTAPTPSPCLPTPLSWRHHCLCDTRGGGRIPTQGDTDQASSCHTGASAAKAVPSWTGCNEHSGFVVAGKQHCCSPCCCQECQPLETHGSAHLAPRHLTHWTGCHSCFWCRLLGAAFSRAPRYWTETWTRTSAVPGEAGWSSCGRWRSWGWARPGRGSRPPGASSGWGSGSPPCGTTPPALPGWSLPSAATTPHTAHLQSHDRPTFTKLLNATGSISQAWHDIFTLKSKCLRFSPFES